jgi:ribosomal protein S18 acetylase RimI-like enzyme
VEITISEGFEDHERPVIAALYWEAFSAKLGRVMGPEHKALRFIATQLDPKFALVARNADGDVLGVAGYKTSHGALIGGGLADLARAYGWLSMLWRAPLLALVERDLADDILLMDGICVGPAARGMGLGSALLDAIKDTARALGLGAVRLDVIDTNPRAKALYERKGFVGIGEEDIGPLRWVFGFSASTKMRCDVTPDAPTAHGHSRLNSA